MRGLGHVELVNAPCWWSDKLRCLIMVTANTYSSGPEISGYRIFGKRDGMKCWEEFSIGAGNIHYPDEVEELIEVMDLDMRAISTTKFKRTILKIKDIN